MADFLWHPRPDDLSESRVARFMARHGLPDAAALRTRAAAEPGWFYPALLEDLGVAWSRPYDRLRDDTGGLPWTEWFLGGRLNLVHNVLDRPAAACPERLAVVAEDDAERVVTLTYAQLAARVARTASALASLGVKPGDAVGLYLPMSAEVAVALLACLKVGAAAVPVFAGFGPEALAARLSDAGAAVLLTADGTVRRGRPVPLKASADEARRLCPGLRHVVVLRHTGEAIPWDASADHWWHDLEAAGDPAFPTADLEASARALLLYTSGTTGRPKAAVHTHGGVQVVTAKEVGYHLDVRDGDRMFWLTDIGWMMGPWEILGVLFHRGTVVLLDGAPDFPDAGRVWRMVERHRVTHLALAPTAVRALMAHGDEPLAGRDLSSVRVLGSTGEPWDEASYLWYFQRAGGGRCPVVNISGGTELMGCLLAPVVTEPLKACSLGGPALGMDVAVLDEEGNSVRGEVGYLVCRGAAPNMTRGFLGDPARYLETYFSRFGEAVWCHGDWAKVDGDGQWFITGRSDDTLKIAGKRVGPGEVEAAATSHPAVREAAAVGLPDPVKGTRLVVVAVARPGHTADADLAAQVRAHIGDRLGATLRPSALLWTTALPVTRSGKILRGLLRRVLTGEAPGDLSSCANPESLAELPTRP